MPPVIYPGNLLRGVPAAGAGVLVREDFRGQSAPGVVLGAPVEMGPQPDGGGGPALLAEAVDLDGLTMHLETADQKVGIVALGAGAWTWSTWLRTDTTAAAVRDILALDSGSSNNFLFLTVFASDGRMSFRLTVGGTTRISKSFGTMSLTFPVDTDWHLLTLKRTALGEMLINIDGGVSETLGTDTNWFVVPALASMKVMLGLAPEGHQNNWSGRFARSRISTTLESDATLLAWFDDPQSVWTSDQRWDLGDGDTDPNYLDSGIVGEWPHVGLNGTLTVPDYPTAPP